ncbi:hypothetical protein NC651_036810 [Populus alba x Populus x berolinensis]|nr:hypothetical protein NC651_036810 [Populus alba x Populus x berolinensis]
MKVAFPVVNGAVSEIKRSTFFVAQDRFSRSNCRSWDAWTNVAHPQNDYHVLWLYKSQRKRTNREKKARDTAKEGKERRPASSPPSSSSPRAAPAQFIKHFGEYGEITDSVIIKDFKTKKIFGGGIPTVVITVDWVASAVDDLLAKGFKLELAGIQQTLKNVQISVYMMVNVIITCYFSQESTFVSKVFTDYITDGKRPSEYLLSVIPHSVAISVDTVQCRRIISVGEYVGDGMEYRRHCPMPTDYFRR